MRMRSERDRPARASLSNDAAPAHPDWAGQLGAHVDHRAVAVLAGWNRLTLMGWLLTPPTLVFTYFMFWGTIRIHGPGQSHWPYLAGLFVLVLCGVLGLLALCGVGGRDERARGCLASASLVPVGGLALWALIHHLVEHGFPS